MPYASLSYPWCSFTFDRLLGEKWVCGAEEQPGVPLPCSCRFRAPQGVRTAPVGERETGGCGMQRCHSLKHRAAGSGNRGGGEQGQRLESILLPPVMGLECQNTSPHMGMAQTKSPGSRLTVRVCVQRATSRMQVKGGPGRLAIDRSLGVSV